MMEFLILFIFVMVSVAFITLLERKILGYLQMRLGPNKVSMYGILQPISDAIKLFMKEKSLNFSSNKILFNLFPLVSLMLMLLIWMIFYWESSMNMNFSLLYFLIISGLSAYVILICGWSSNSKYSLLGAYRGVSQTVSYEVSMAFVMITFFMFMSSMSMNSLWKMNIYSINLSFPLIIILMFWLIIMTAEVNRAPFDFAEGESELVSGFNVEYGAGNFALLFLSEYGNILFMSYISVFIFYGWSILMMLILIIAIIWIRGTFPRFRYDNLMMLTWKIILPLSIFWFSISYSLNILM